MEELRGTFENSATENPLVSDSQKKPRIRTKKRKKDLFVISHNDKLNRYILFCQLYMIQNAQND